LVTFIAGRSRDTDRKHTTTMKTFREQLQGYSLDNVSNIVYNAGQLSIPHQGRQLYYMLSRKPHSYSAVFKVFWNRVLGTFTFTQECVKNSKMGNKGSQTRRVPVADLCRLLTRLRKEILNSIIMRKLTALKEKQYGKNNGRL
jgi:hypothetical protein